MSLTLKKHELEYVLAGLASPMLARTNAPVSIKARSAAKAIHSLLGAGGCSPRETAAKIIASLWRSNVLLKYAHSVPKRELWAFFEKNVETPAAGIFETVSEMEGAIIATPHYGPFLPLCLDLIRRFDGRRRLNIMFNDPAKTPSNRAHAELFRSLARNVGFYYPDRKGTIAALKGLKRGEVLALMPDVYFQSESLMALPFFGRLLGVMPGTSFFSVKSGSPIVPVYPYPSDTFGMRVVIDDPVCPATVRAAGGDTGEDSMFFKVTRRSEHTSLGA